MYEEVCGVALPTHILWVVVGAWLIAVVAMDQNILVVWGHDGVVAMVVWCSACCVYFIIIIPSYAY